MAKKILIIVHKKHSYYYFCFAIFSFLILSLFLLLIHNTFTTAIVKSALATKAEHKKPKLAIIIDDLGSNRNGVEEMTGIKRHLTFAVLPFYAISKEQADKVHKKGYEVIIHLPMESKSGEIISLGPRPILTSLNDDEISKIVQDSFQIIPFAVGANIHMGSRASENDRIMTCIMRIIKAKKLYFVDSKTAEKSVCKSIAEKFEINFVENNVFLEASSKSKSEIKKQLDLAGRIALKKGFAVCIGHVGPAGGVETAKAIEEMIPELESKGIELVYVSELFK